MVYYEIPINLLANYPFIIEYRLISKSEARGTD